MPDLPPFIVRSLLGFLLGLALGFVARRGRFCTLGAIEDAVYGSDTRRLRAWLAAIAVAIAGVAVLERFGGLDLSYSIYAGSRIHWGGAVIGGAMFGFGMALVGTCGFGALLRFGGGDLKSLLTLLLMAATATMTMRGVTGLARMHLIEPLSLDLPDGASQRLPQLIGLEGWGTAAFAFAVAALIALAACWRTARLRFPKSMLTGVAIGALIVLGWWATGISGFDPFEQRRVESFSFVAPLGDTLLYLMLASGLRPDFPVGAVLGVIAGASAAAALAGEFRWEAPDDVREVKRQVVGALLMGSGGIAALGCTIGQGVTGLSTLSVGSLLAIAAIVAGARIGLYVLVESERGFGRWFLR